MVVLLLVGKIARSIIWSVTVEWGSLLSALEGQMAHLVAVEIFLAVLEC